MQFELLADDLRVRVPWTAPDLFRLKLWYKQAWAPAAGSVELRPFIFGDLWSSGNEQAQSACLWLETSVPWHQITASQWRALRESMLRVFLIALERHRLLLNISIGEPESAGRIGELLLEAEVNRSIAHLTRDRVPPRLDLIARLETRQAGVTTGVMEIELESEPTLSDYGGWHRVSHHYLATLAKLAAQGRVYYKPVH